jgi:hypothetical protein
MGEFPIPKSSSSQSNADSIQLSCYVHQCVLLLPPLKASFFVVFEKKRAMFYRSTSVPVEVHEMDRIYNLY